MKGGPARTGAGDKGGARFFSILGFLVLAATVVGAVLLVTRSDIFEVSRDKSLTAGTAAMSKGEWEKAVGFFRRSLKKNPDNAFARVALSRAYLRTGRPERALQEINGALKLDPDNFLAYGQRGIVQKLRGRHDEAVSDFSRAVELKPNYVWARAELADLFRKRGDFKRALASVKRALKTRPDYVPARRLSALILLQMGKCEEAVAELEKRGRSGKTDPQCIQDKAWILLTCPDAKFRDPVQALKLADLAFRMTKGTDGFVLETLAEAQFRNGNPHRAVNHQSKAIALVMQRCPDGSCVREMRERLKKYELAGRLEKRTNYDVLPIDGVLGP
jgi:tetratricopeptide (TPR) repeat protein